MFNLKIKIKINGLLSDPIYPCHVGSFADFLLSMFLYVVATEVANHFNDNDKGLKV